MRCLALAWGCNMGSKIDLFGSRLYIAIDGRTLGEIAGVGHEVNFVESVKVNISLMHFFNVEVKLNPTFDQAVKLLNSGLMGIGFNVEEVDTQNFVGALTSLAGVTKTPGAKVSFRRIQIQMEYGGRTSNAFSAILQAPQIHFGADGIQITLVGIGFIFSRTKQFGNRNIKGTAYELVQKLLKEDSSLPIEVEFKPQAKELLKRIKIKGLLQYKSNLETVRDLLHDNGCELMHIGNQKNGGERYQVQTIEEKRSDLRYTFVMYGNINPDAGIFPIMDMKCPTTNLLLPAGAWANTVNVFDRNLNKTGEESNSKKESTAADQAVSVTSPDGTIAGGSAASTGDNVVHVPKEIGKTLTNTYKNYASRVFEWNIETVGVVDLLPGQVVKVQVGPDGNTVKSLTGYYDLFEVEHTFANSGVDTHLKCYRTGGVAGKVSGQFENLASKLNKAIKAGLETDINTIALEGAKKISDLTSGFGGEEDL